MQPHTCPCYTFAGSLSDLGSAALQKNWKSDGSVSPAKICSSTNCLRLELSTFTLKKMDLCTDGIFSRPDLGHTVK
jgi:hypothetical protein